MYYWRRRLPNALANWFHKRHLFLGLQTPDPNFARRLVVLLDAKLEEVVTAFEHAEMHQTRIPSLCRLIHSLGYELVFPDLFSPTTKSPLGNRYYKFRF